MGTTKWAVAHYGLDWSYLCVVVRLFSPVPITLTRRYSGENTIHYDKLLQRDGRDGRMRKVASCRDFSWCLNAPAAVSP